MCLNLFVVTLVNKKSISGNEIDTVNSLVIKCLTKTIINKGVITNIG